MTILMDLVESALKRTETELVEWKIELGRNYPTFLNHYLMAKLLKSEQEIEYLRRVLKSYEAIR